MNDRYALLPTLRLKAVCISHIIKDWKPARFLELGAGTGYLTKLFLDNGYSGVCHDISPENIKITKNNLTHYNNVTFETNVQDIKKESFDYIFAFDVLEHIEDDAGNLMLWASFLRTGGKALISVPAHMTKFGRKDEIMGHYRRYNRNELYELMKRNGFKNINILCYGFPLLNITGKVIDVLFGLSHQSKKYDGLSCEERSIKSGVDTPDISNKLFFLFGGPVISVFSYIQKFFFTKDIGAAYVAYGTKE